MFLTWSMTIGFFIASYYTTVVIFDRLKERDQQDLAQLESQLKNVGLNELEVMKQAV